MKNYWYFILFVFCVCSCQEELPDLEKDILHDTEIPLFRMDSVSIIPGTPNLKIRVHYSSIKHTELTSAQRTVIRSTAVLKDGNEVDRKFIHPGDDTEVLSFYFEDAIEPGIICYDFHLTGRANNSDLSRSTQLCVDMRPGISISPLEVSANELLFDYTENVKTFQIKNTGFQSFNWSLTNSFNELSTTSSNGTLEGDSSISITLELDRTNLVSQSYFFEILIENNLGNTVNFPITINSYKEEKWFVDGKIIDAEYDRNNDVIVAVSEAPNELRIINPSNNSVESILLPMAPTCVSVGLNGDYAVVGHNSRFSHVNLSTMVLENTFPISADVHDIVLAPNDFVYAFPKEDQWVKIWSFDLSNEIQTSSENLIYEQTKAKLHPSGNYIYGADNGLSPSDFEKYDITDGAAQYLYESSYHGDFEFSGDIWISDDGNKLFAKSRNVFNTSTNEEDDIIHYVELEGEGLIKSLDYSSTAEKVYALFSAGATWNETPTNELRIYNTDLLTYQGSIELPGFLIIDGNGDGDFYESEGHFGFFNSNGTKYYALVKITEGSGLQNEWAIATIDVD